MSKRHARKADRSENPGPSVCKKGRVESEQSRDERPKSTKRMIVGREAELKFLTDVIDQSVLLDVNSSVYVSGPPGTGKTLCIRSLLSEFEENHPDRLTVVYVNSLNFKTTRQILVAIAEGMNMPANARSNEAFLSRFETHHVRNKLILVIDEIDHIAKAKNGSPLLKRLYQWPHLPNSNLACLIGISNSLDLTDRRLPFLHGKIARLHFQPYTRQELVCIVKEQFEQDTRLDNTAVELAARKVAAVTGDVRKAIDLCREATLRKHVAKFSTSAKENVEPTSDLSLMLTVTSQKASNRLPSSLPLQQQVLLASTLKATKACSGGVSVAKLQQTYKKACAKVQFTACSSSEFSSMCSLLESQGLVSMYLDKGGSKMVTMTLDDAAVETCLQDAAMFSLIMRS